MTITDTLRQLGLSAPDPRSDGELVERFARTRDEAAFAELLRRHGPTVYGVCRRVVGSGPDADDAFQAVFLVFARKAGSVRPPGMVGNWLYGVAVRTAKKARVMNAKRAKREQASRERERPECRNAPVAHAPGSLDTLAVIDAELAALPDVYRAAFVACDLNGRSRSEAARELGWPEGTVAARVAKARELLAARLRKRGVTLGVGLFIAVAVPTATATVTLHAVRELLAVGTASAVTPAAQHLSDEVVKSMTTIHAKWLAAVGVLTLALATGGAVLLAGGPDKAPPVREPIKAPVPKVAETVWVEAPPIEFKDNGRVTSIAFAPSGKTFAVLRAGGQIDFYDPVTRKHQQSMNFLGDPKSNPNREGGTYPAIAFRPRPHAKLGDVFAITHKNGVNFGTTGIGLLVDEPPAVNDLPTKWVLEGMDPHQVIWTADNGLIATNGAEEAIRLEEKLQEKGRWALTHGKVGQSMPFAAIPNTYAMYVAPSQLRDKPNDVHIATVAPLSSPQTVLSGHEARPVAAVVSKNSQRIVTADVGGTLIVWEGEKYEFKEKRRVELGEGVVQLALAPDGKTVAVLRAFVDTTLFGRSGRTLTTFHLYVFDVTDPPEDPKPLWTTGQSPLLGEEKSAGPFSLAFSPDGKTLLAAFADPYIPDDPKERGGVTKSMGVKVWTLNEGTIKAPVPKPVETEWKEGKTIELRNPAPIRAITFSPDGKTVVVGQNSEVAAVDTKTREERLILKIKEAENPIFRIRHTPDGTRLGIANWNSYGLAGTEPKDGTTDYTTWAGQMTNVAFSPDGTRLAASDGRTVKVHSVPRKEKEEPLQFGPLGGEESKDLLPSDIAFSPKGDRLLLLPNFRVPADWRYDPKTGFAVSDPEAATHWVAVVWSLKGNEVKVLKHGKARITAADWSADGRHIVTGDDDGTVIVWDTEEFKEKSRVELRVPVIENVLAPKPVSQIALAPDGRTLAVVSHHPVATGGPDRPFADTNQFELRVFDVTAPPKDPKPVWTTQKPFVGPVSVAFAPDGKTLLVVVADTFMVVPGVGETSPPSMVTLLELVPKK